MPRHSNQTSFKKGFIRTKNSIKKQAITMKKQYKSGIRKTHHNFILWSHKEKPKPYKKVECLKCGNEFKRTSPRQKWCKDCVPNRKMRSFIMRYNLSASEYEKLSSSNNGLCWICGIRKAVFVDHNHKTGKVRGFLCSFCNTALPIVEDKEILKRAIKYVSFS